MDAHTSHGPGKGVKAWTLCVVTIPTTMYMVGTDISRGDTHDQRTLRENSRVRFKSPGSRVEPRERRTRFFSS